MRLMSRDASTDCEDNVLCTSRISSIVTLVVQALLNLCTLRCRAYFEAGMISWFKFSVRVPVTVHIRCFLYRHVCGSLVDLLHFLFC